MTPAHPADAHTTAQRLEALIDTALFERIAGAVLRIARPAFASMSHVGMNAAGQTVRAPVDGLGVAGVSAGTSAADGGRPFLLVAHTTTARAGLRRKWLAPGSDAERLLSGSTSRKRRRQPDARRHEPGDVVKAARMAAELRARTPGARVLLVLTSNRVPDTDLLVDVHAAAAGAGLELEVFDRTALAHFLDYTPDGTAVRRTLLGLETDRLSAPLLVEIGGRSIDAYAAEHPGLEPAEWVDRAEDDVLERALAGGAALIGIVGPSGLGKSGLALRALARHHAATGVVLWARAEHLAQAPSLAGLLDRALRDWHPGLEPEAGARALELLRDANGSPVPLRLVVDDVMRLPDPVAGVRRVLALARGLTADGNSMHGGQGRGERGDPARAPATVQFLVPLWPEVWRAVGEAHRNATWVDEVAVGRLQDDAAQRLLADALARRGLRVGEETARDIAGRIDGDPLLAALLVDSAVTTEEELVAAAAAVVDRFITDALNELAASPGSHATAADGRHALDRLALHMLRARRLEPTWAEVRRWLAGDPDALQALRAVVRQGRICREGAPPDPAPLRFRHDRLRDALLADAAVAYARRGGDPDALLDDPLLAPYVGAAIARGAVPPERLAALVAASPAALAEALRHAGSRPFPHRADVLAHLDAWTRGELNEVARRDAVRRDDGMPTLDAVFASLSGSRIPELLALLAPWPPWPHVLLARFAAGAHADGLRLYEAARFSAFTINPWRDRALAAALARDRAGVISLLNETLTAPECSAASRLAALHMAGDLGAAELAAAVATAWPGLAPEPNLVQAALWATLRTMAGVQPEARHRALGSCLDAWRALPNDDGAPPLGTASRALPLYELPHALARDLGDGAVTALAEALEQERKRTGTDALAHELAVLLKGIDHPAAQEGVVRYTAPLHARQRAMGGGTVIPWVMSIGDDWDPERGGHRRALTPRTRARLRALWQDDGDDAHVREVALRLWAANGMRDDVPLLRSIEGDARAPGMPRTALWQRLRLGDRAAVPSALALAVEEPVWYWWLAPCWDARVEQAVRSRLETRSLLEADEDASADAPPRTAAEGGGGTPPREARRETVEMLQQLLKRAPAAAATEILAAVWPRVAAHASWVRVALAVATPASVRLAHDAIRGGVEPHAAFQYVNQDWALGSRAGDVPTTSHLAAVEPYVAALDEMFLEDLADGCRRRGFDAWAERFLVPRLPDRVRARAFPTDADLDWLLADEIASAHRAFLEFWIERAAEDPKVRPRLVPLFLRHLGAQQDVDALRRAALAVRLVGTRADVHRLGAVPVHADPVQRATILRATSFAVRRRTGEEASIE